MLRAAAFLLTSLLSAEPGPIGGGPLERGEKLLGRKEYAAAEKELRRAVEETPGSERAHGNLALALLFQHKNREAVDEGRLAAAFGPKSPEARYIYGMALAADGRPIEAAREFEKAVALKPDVIPPLAALASAYAAAEDSRTVATYEKLITLRPDDPKVRAELAEYLWLTNRTEQGNRAMSDALNAFPADATLRLQDGRALVQQDRLLDAAPMLEEARRLGSTDAETFALLAGAYEHAGNATAAREAFAAGVEIHPESASLQHDLGRLLLAEGRAEEALPHLEQAVRAAPGQASYQLDLGRAFQALGRLDAAEAVYRRAVQLAPGQYATHYALGRLLQREGKSEEAQKELEKHRELYEAARRAVAASNASDAQLALAWARYDGGEAADALARFQALPESPESLRGQALSLSRLQKHRQAVKALEKAHALAPEDHRIELLLVTERSRAAEAP